jgi:hypothetical protein
MGVPARGGRRESWAPPDVGSAHPAERAFTVYRFRPGPARPPLPHRPHLRGGPGEANFGTAQEIAKPPG